MDLTEAEDIEERQQEYTELYKQDLNDPDKHNGGITHLESEILECEVKWDLGSITMNKASRGDRIPAEFFEILKDNSVKGHSVKVKEVAQSCPILCDPMGCSLPGSSVHGIFQERVLEWVAISFSGESSDPGIEPGSPALRTGALPSEPPGKPRAHSVFQLIWKAQQ